MTAPDKPGLSNEEGKPTHGQIGGEEALKFQDAQTLAAYWVMSDSENRRKMWESDLKKICEALLSVTGQGQEERDYTPHWVKEKFSRKRYLDLLDLIDSLPSVQQKGVCVADANTLRDYLLESWGAIQNLASADKAQADRKRRNK